MRTENFPLILITFSLELKVKLVVKNELVIHCKKLIVKVTKHLGKFGTKTSGKLSKPFLIFRITEHTIIANRITLTEKY